MVMGNKQARSGKAEGARCRRHRQQGAGVCATCLRERLSRSSASSSVPSVVRRAGGEGEGEGEEREYSSCSEASTAYSSEASSAASSECASPAAAEPAFHDEMRRAARVSLLMRHERVVGDADAVAAFLVARRAEQQQRRRAATSFWAKLLRATRTTRGGGGKEEDGGDGCSLAARGKTLEERAAAAKWVLF
ncbi:hypothetical protein U9M48_021857 [Paspalum notatum var. saurae]|uniref:Uncharacterized protein n=1 Tax=Paspalum notatum var. saurae TaxID=547442 RepID=A0AAQ3TH64_PASNO